LSDHAAGSGMSLAIPDELVERIAARAAELLAERQRPAEPELLTVAEAAGHLRSRPQRIYDLVSQGRLPCVKGGARVLIRRADLLAYLDEGKP
jgi:excisionase family DNA binding protein